ncbi:MAG: hypothetical protein VX730_05530 [Pseudomonadota bacterium]|nr:hypothetical protein [Pseudomonadota bacterium]
MSYQSLSDQAERILADPEAFEAGFAEFCRNFSKGAPFAYVEVIGEVGVGGSTWNSWSSGKSCPSYLISEMLIKLMLEVYSREAE